MTGFTGLLSVGVSFFIVMSHIPIVWGVNICKGKKNSEIDLPYFHVNIRAENKVVVCNSIG